MNRLALKLEPGDLRSKGKSEEIVKEVLRDPKLFPQLIEAIEMDHAGVRMRASDAIEKITVERPELLKPYKSRLLAAFEKAEQQELRWHLAQIIPRLPLTSRQKEKAFTVLQVYLKDKSSIVKTFALQAMADIAKQDDYFRRKALAKIRLALKNGTPAMQSRARKLVAQMEKKQ